MRNIEVDYKFTLLVNGKKAFGQGPCILLEKTGELGSLKRASQELNMSYSKAWRIIKEAERLFSYKLLDSKIGGKEGGGSHLTEEAKELIQAYKKSILESKKEVEEIFKKNMKNI